MLLKKKDSDDMKAQYVIDGRKQRERTEPGAAASPTVATKFVFMDSVIYAR